MSIYGIVDYANGHRDTMTFNYITGAEEHLKGEVNAYPGSRARLFDGERMLACYEAEPSAPPISLRVHKPLHPFDAWYNLYITIGGQEYEIGNSSIDEVDCRKTGQEIAEALKAADIPVLTAGLYEYVV